MDADRRERRAGTTGCGIAQEIVAVITGNWTAVRLANRERAVQRIQRVERRESLESGRGTR